MRLGVGGGMGVGVGHGPGDALLVGMLVVGGAVLVVVGMPIGSPDVDVAIAVSMPVWATGSTDVAGACSGVSGPAGEHDKVSSVAAKHTETTHTTIFLRICISLSG